MTWLSPPPQSNAKLLLALTTRFSHVSEALPHSDTLKSVCGSVMDWLSSNAFTDPCAPINTTVEQNCTSNSMTVKWHDNSTAQNYTVKAASASGVNSTCESTNSSCSFLDLSCGQLYSFTVMGYSNVCTSDVSPPIKSYTGKEFDFSKHNFCVESEFYYSNCIKTTKKM